MPKLTATLVRSAKPKDRAYELRDGGAHGVPGLVLRVQKSGRKVYSIQLARGRKRKLGTHPGMTLDRARHLATEALKAYDPANEDPKYTGTLKEFIDDEYASHYRTHHTSDRGLASLKPFESLYDRKLSAIDQTAIKRWRTQRVKSGTKPATVNRNVAALKAALSYAVDEGFLPTNPLYGLSRLKVEEENRVRYLTDDEEARLRDALIKREDGIRSRRRSANQWRADRRKTPLPDLSNFKFADHLRPMVLLSMNTGIRRGELFKLKWSDVASDVLTIKSGSAKSKRARHIPLNTEALDTVTNWRDQTAVGTYVFENDGAPFDDVKNGWGAVLSDAGIVDFRWHDLRHHFASRMVMAGIPLNTVRELLGHSDLTMTLRYAHLAPGHMRDAVEALTR